MDDWNGRVVVVTGAGSGIGRALAIGFARRGARVAAADVELAALEATSELLLSEVPDAELLTTTVDVSDAEQVEGLADQVYDRWGEVDLLCNNAGVFVGGLLWERSPADFDFTLGVNLYGILHGIRAFVPRMIERGTEAHVVNTSSIAGLLGSPFAGPYGISKFAALAASESLAGDLIAVGSPVRAHALCPGMIRTRIAQSERNRPADLASPRTEDRDMVDGFLSETVDGGMDPAEVVDIVAEALTRPDQFLILTHPEFAEQVAARGSALQRLELPAIPSFD